MKTDPFVSQATGGNSFIIPGLSRKDDILFHQLKTGKTPVVHACLAINKKNNRSVRKCTECRVVEDVEHLLLKCSLRGRERQIHLKTNQRLKMLILSVLSKKAIAITKQSELCMVHIIHLQVQCIL